jgi:hypothetical protein
MKRRRADPRHTKIESLIHEIKEVNDAAKFQPDRWEKEQLLAEKSMLQSHLLREHGELFEILPEGRGLVGITGRDDAWDACHAVVENLDPDVRQWVKAQIRGR